MLKELQRIAKATYPRAELVRLRNLATERLKRHMAKAKISLEMQMRARVAKARKESQNRSGPHTHPCPPLQLVREEWPISIKTHPWVAALAAPATRAPAIAYNYQS